MAASSLLVHSTFVNLIVAEDVKDDTASAQCCDWRFFCMKCVSRCSMTHSLSAHDATLSWPCCSLMYGISYFAGMWTNLLLLSGAHGGIHVLFLHFTFLMSVMTTSTAITSRDNKTSSNAAN